MDNLYSIWVEGREITTSFIRYMEADYMASQYARDGYEDVKVVMAFKINNHKEK